MKSIGFLKTKDNDVAQISNYATIENIFKLC